MTGSTPTFKGWLIFIEDVKALWSWLFPFRG